MPMKTLLAGCGLLFLLSGCNNPIAVGAAVLVPTTPPVNTVLTGPCKEEFGMPDSRRANCELYYWIRGEDAPWVARQKYYAATAYQPGELECTRTRGEIAECSVVSGPPHQPPYIVAPNTLKSE
jgi:hypothetical protein